MHRIACPCKHEQNGLSERKIRHTIDTGLTLLAHSQVPFCFWNYTFHTAINSINELPTPVLHNISPHQKLFNIKPKYMDTKIFGCVIFSNLRPYNRFKFSF